MTKEDYYFRTYPKKYPIKSGLSHQHSTEELNWSIFNIFCIDNVSSFPILSLFNTFNCLLSSFFSSWNFLWTRTSSSSLSCRWVGHLSVSAQGSRVWVWFSPLALTACQHGQQGRTLWPHTVVPLCTQIDFFPPQVSLPSSCLPVREKRSSCLKSLCTLLRLQQCSLTTLNATSSRLRWRQLSGWVPKFTPT